MKINTYLTFDGNCEEALNFYIKALGGKPVMMLRYSEAPEGHPCSEGMGKKIMHGRIHIGDNVIMASDAPAGRFKEHGGFSISINVATVAEGKSLFEALSEKGEVFMPYGETFWAEGFGMLTDKFGVAWMVNCEKKG
jgi:PhnB protein